MNYGYARVSTIDQDTTSQVETLTQFGIDKVITEYASGKNLTDRPQLQEILRHIRSGDTLIVTKVDRIARNTLDALQIADQLKSRGCGLICLDLGDVDINSDIGRVIYTTISAFAEMERKRIKQRQREGIEQAQKEGKHLGRKPMNTLEQIQDAMTQTNGNKTQAAKILGCNVRTIQRVLAKGEQK